MKNTAWLDLARDLQNEIVEQRRQLHTIPEVGFQENKTAEYLKNKLSEYGYTVRTGVGETGVIADLGANPTVAIRAEMDGLPIADSTSALYRSKHEGVSHSCGHDVNMACALAAAKLLARQDIRGVRIIMQPASEDVCDANGKTGTYRIIAEGGMTGLKAVIGMHIDSTMEPGCVGIITESAKVAPNNFTVKVSANTDESGRSLEAAKFDAVKAATIFMNELFSQTPQGADQSEGAAIVINAIETAAAPENQPCREIILKGVMQVFSKESRREQNSRLEKAGAKTQAAGALCQMEYQNGDGPGHLDAAINETMRQVALELVGDKNVRMVKRKTWTEDFAALLTVTPGSMILLGGEIRSSRRSHHSGAFDVDESQLYVGAAMLAATAQRLVQEA